MKYTVDEIANIIGGDLIGKPDLEITSISLDSRKLTRKDQLFIAIDGKHHDGHQYIPELIKKGVTSFVVEKNIKLQNNNVTFILVENALDALQKIAVDYRKKFNFPVIGITGSNGKTIVKEWLSQLFILAGKIIVKSPKSYNSQTGVPLSILMTNQNEDLGVFEAGISTTGEMSKLKSIISPDTVIFTNLGTAHSEGFKNDKEKLVEKLILAQSADKLVIRKNHYPVIDELLKKQEHQNLISWSTSQNTSVNYQVLFKTGASSTTILINELGYKVNFSDAASLENITHCIVAGLEHGIETEIIQLWCDTLSPLKMRLEVKDGIQNCKIINDAYNNDLNGLEVAFDFLKQQNFNLKKTLIISDIYQSGLEDKILYCEVAQKVTEREFDKIIAIGPKISANASVFNNTNISFYTSTDDFLDTYDFSQFEKETILLKGARIFRFEKIAKQLERKIHRTTVEVNLSALEHNLNYYREQLNPSTKIMVMVKAFAYGTGDVEVAQLLEHHKVDYLAVAYIDEGIQLRKKGINLPIMVMNTSVSDLKELLQYRLEPEVFSMSQLTALVGKLGNDPICIHIKLDTGMHRLGFVEDEVVALANYLKKLPSVTVSSVFSHLSGSDSEEFDDFTRKQIAHFEKSCKIIKDKTGKSFQKHILNSAGIQRFPHHQFDMVRLGIGLYGISPVAALQEQLKTVITLKTVVSQIKEVKKGDTIGYSRKGKAITAMKIATIAIGYADGFRREFSNGIGKVIIHGKLAPVIGNVCMDMTMVDITHIPNVKDGDEVIIYSSLLSLTKQATNINTIPYELLTGIGQRVPRIYYLE